jgi:hypothetical protein
MDCANDRAILSAWNAPAEESCANDCETLMTWEVMTHLPWP